MRYSIAKLLAVMVIINVVVCLTFAVPIELGFPLLTFISLIVLPPALAVAVLNTRGARQAFFLGCMLAGVAHFIISLYISVYYAFDESGLELEDSPIRYIHLIGYTVGLFGGLSGLGMYYFVTLDQAHPTGKESGKKLKPTNEQPEFSNDSVDGYQAPVRTPLPK